MNALRRFFKKTPKSETTPERETKHDAAPAAKPHAPERPSAPKKAAAPGGDAFKALGLADTICQAVAREGYVEPTPIQRAAIPPILEGRDLLGCAQTGTGKTAAFALPIIDRLLRMKARSSGRGARVLVLTPTRELALQIDESFANYGKDSRLSHAVIFGGVSQNPQVAALKQHPEVVTATPGRLLDLLDQKLLRLDDLQVFVLDEADRMLDMGFIHDVRKVIKLLPKERQNLLFSATMPESIRALADGLLHDPAYVEVTPVSSTAETIDQRVYFVNRANKRHLLVHVMEQEQVKRALVFTRTKFTANRVAEHLSKHGVTAAAIHANKSQSARQNALANFKAGKTKVLVASDIASRGIDIDEITHVINYDLPNIAETYVHRIGRTGRAKATGIALSFCDSGERGYLRDIERITGAQIKVEADHPYTKDADQAEEPITYGGGPRRGGGGGRGPRPAGNSPQGGGRGPRPAGNSQGGGRRPSGGGGGGGGKSSARRPRSRPGNGNSK